MAITSSDPSFSGIDAGTAHFYNLFWMIWQIKMCISFHSVISLLVIQTKEIKSTSIYKIFAVAKIYVLSWEDVYDLWLRKKTSYVVRD